MNCRISAGNFASRSLRSLWFDFKISPLVRPVVSLMGVITTLLDRLTRFVLDITLKRRQFLNHLSRLE